MEKAASVSWRPSTTTLMMVEFQLKSELRAHFQVKILPSIVILLPSINEESVITYTFGSQYSFAISTQEPLTQPHFVKIPLKSVRIFVNIAQKPILASRTKAPVSLLFSFTTASLILELVISSKDAAEVINPPKLE
ncbi:Hypothetical_protein [Hexamita inflata]|uniref:Hypothetical_protein n=1 Tax=Hexamita inflata TaxID=28002 RepID=A0AA86Q2Z4_9EUKA|nr:Hypothetical protein HINF_LOCUS36282 [Hexamita inflata]